MSKSPDAFRTISEVAEWLGVQAHVLRFWESKFTQVKPVKRAGGRRYYRPNDMMLLGGIKRLLHDDGMTIKGVQKMLREKGTSEVVALSPPIAPEDEALEEIDSTVVQFRAQDDAVVDAPDLPDALEDAIAETSVADAGGLEDLPEAEPLDAEDTQTLTGDAPDNGARADTPSEAAPVDFEAEEDAAPGLFDLKDEPQDAVVTEESFGLEPEIESAEEMSEPPEDKDAPEAEGADMAVLPSFLHRRQDTPAPITDNEPPVQKPNVIDAPDPPREDEIEVATGTLGHIARLRRLNAQQAAAILPLMDELRAVIERQSSARSG